ncbi:hypothetical protein [Methylorubrum thiocyanatum]|uniref:Uncharacterized protein n=1 Tax=Methylorubrum thiocyanatum TaxID=47958 RepID=A0AA40S183_9HYPH|nr:hypothetical protein [Methylorubrum thiocyanatum]MBA8912740.1 hypothetical protein [Methylorubrum thiocyanatum]GJE80106.1 hypothetical protein CJNNKLLH_1437 [Methylorubrum thiocyanatum]
MRERPHRSVHGRAIIGVIALYALVLHAFVTVLAPTPPRLDGGVLCAEHAASGERSKDGQSCGHHACCTQVQAVHLPPPVQAASSLAVWPPRAVPVIWRAAETVRARAPPDQGTSPRGPPAV